MLQQIYSSTLFSKDVTANKRHGATTASLKREQHRPVISHSLALLPGPLPPELGGLRLRPRRPHARPRLPRHPRQPRLQLLEALPPQEEAREGAETREASETAGISVGGDLRNRALLAVSLERGLGDGAEGGRIVVGLLPESVVLRLCLVAGAEVTIFSYV